MRSVSSSEVICNISMRWRNCGVSTSRWERLVVNLRDIPQIGSPKHFTSSFRIIAVLPAPEDYNRLMSAVGRLRATKGHKEYKLTCEIFRRGKAFVLRRLPSNLLAAPNERCGPPPLYKHDRSRRASRVHCDR